MLICKNHFNTQQTLLQHQWFDFIYDKNLTGFLKFFNKSTKVQRFANIDNMRDFMKYEKQINARYFTNKNLYISLCTYKSADDGTQKNISAVQGFQIDIDYNKISFYKGRTPENIIALLEMDYFNTEIPVPNIIECGNNLRLIYVFNEPIGATTKSLALINKMIKYLTEKVKVFGGDSQTVNSAIRVCSSFNTSNNCEVRYYLYSEYKYNLKELQENWLPELKKTVKRKENINRKSKGNIIEFKKNWLTLAHARCKDIEKLVELREGDLCGYREKTLFLYRNFLLCLNMDKSRVEELVENLNNEFTKPLKKANSKTKHLDYKKPIQTNKDSFNELYLFSNKTIIEMLDISISEQKLLSTIISSEIKSERRAVRQKKYYEENRIGLSREEQKESTFQEIKKMRELNFTQKEIATKLSLSISTVKRYCSKI